MATRLKLLIVNIKLDSVLELQSCSWLLTHIENLCRISDRNVKNTLLLVCNLVNNYFNCDVLMNFPFRRHCCRDLSGKRNFSNMPAFFFFLE